MNVLRKVSRDASVQRWRCCAASSATITRSSSSFFPVTALVPGQLEFFDSLELPSRCSPPLKNINTNLGRRSFSTTSTTSATRTAASTETKDSNDALIQEGKKRILASALQGDAAQAQETLDQLEPLLQSESNSESLLECRDAVLDAWISHQARLFEEYHQLPVDDDSIATHNQQKQLRLQIFAAAQRAHDALEQTIPFLSRPAMAIYASRTAPTKTKKSEEFNLGDPNVIIKSSQSPKRKQQQQTPQVMLHKCNSVLTAWAKASQVTTTRQGIPQRATYLLQRMEASKSSIIGSSGVSVQPTTESYNAVLEAWAWSREHLRATMAEQIFQTMVKQSRKSKSKGNSSVASVAKPNGESYRWIIQAWCHSKQRKSAFTATGHLMRFLRRLEKGWEDIEPTLDTYHMVMKAWTTAEDKNTPIKAMGVLRIMEYAESKKFCSIPVDEICYRYFLQASAKAAVIPEQGPLADQILNKLKDRQIVPDGETYGAAIKTWKNAALNPLYGASREHSVTRAVELLEEVTVAHQRSATRMVKPTTGHFNDVLEALAESYKAASRDIATALVDVMENSISDDNTDDAFTDILPNSDTYKWLLLVHAKSRKQNKLESASQVLERVKANLATLAEDSEKLEDDLVGVYNAFVEVCASVKIDKTEEEERTNNSEVLQSALEAVAELRSLYGLNPNSQTYANLLKVCETQLDVGQEKSRITEEIFQSCCEEGLVDEIVLKALKSAVSDEQYFQLVISRSDSVEGIRMVPEDWTKNVGVNRVITADGRKAMPLSADGRYTITRAMKEFKMRKLRSKVNQRVLHGGRLKLDKKQIGKPMRIHLDEEAFA